MADTILFAVERSLSLVDDVSQYVFYLDGPGGSWKTFTYNYLVHELRGCNMMVIASAWVGIAATLLIGGYTVHSLFKLPVLLLDTSICNVKPTSKLADFLRKQSLFIIDVASMVSLNAMNALDKMLRDITGIGKLFEGKVFLFGGDFCQVLPVIKRGMPTSIIESCLKSSFHWPHFHKLQLSTNMHAIEDRSFTEWLIRLGNGELGIIEKGPFKGAIEITEIFVEHKCIFDDNLNWNDYAN